MLGSNVTSWMICMTDPGHPQSTSAPVAWEIRASGDRRTEPPGPSCVLHPGHSLAGARQGPGGPQESLPARQSLSWMADPACVWVGGDRHGHKCFGQNWEVDHIFRTTCRQPPRFSLPLVLPEPIFPMPPPPRAVGRENHPSPGVIDMSSLPGVKCPILGGKFLIWWALLNFSV